MVTYHPSAIKTYQGAYRARIIIRAPGAESIHTGENVYNSKNAARNAARETAHISINWLARRFPSIEAKVAP